MKFRFIKFSFKNMLTMHKNSKINNHHSLIILEILKLIFKIQQVRILVYFTIQRKN
jgi:hypothetical protein